MTCLHSTIVHHKKQMKKNPPKKFLECVIYLEHKSFWAYIQTLHDKYYIQLFYPSEYQLSFDYLFMSILNLKLNSTSELQPRILSFSATKFPFLC